MPAPGLPWVASPGEALKGAPPLWALASVDQIRIVQTTTTVIPTGADVDAWRAAGWFEVVDADGRSR